MSSSNDFAYDGAALSAASRRTWRPSATRLTEGGCLPTRSFWLLRSEGRCSRRVAKVPSATRCGESLKTGDEEHLNGLELERLHVVVQKHLVNESTSSHYHVERGAAGGGAGAAVLVCASPQPRRSPWTDWSILDGHVDVTPDDLAGIHLGRQIHQPDVSPAPSAPPRGRRLVAGW